MRLHTARILRGLILMAFILGTIPGKAQVETTVRINKSIELLDNGSVALGLLAFDY